MNGIIKPSILPGFMELLPSEQIQFNRILETIKDTFEKNGFTPMDTPIIEKTEILLAKGGEETDKQTYSFTRGSNNLSLRFDLTVPFARYSAQYLSELTFPFRRYQIGKVFRGERNQRGRYREFYQCDIDIISNRDLSIASDAELPSIMYSILSKIGLQNFTIRINNRKLLNGFLKSLELSDITGVLRAIDKVDKIGSEAFKNELICLGICSDTVDKIYSFIILQGSNEEILSVIKKLDIDNETYKAGLNEIDEVSKLMKVFGVPEDKYVIDLKIARGLDYYTGTVYETILDEYPELGSICSGGRYDNLAQNYTKEKLQGVGMSIGLTRLFYVLKEIGLLKGEEGSTLTKVLIVTMDKNFEVAIAVAANFKNKGINTQIYFEEEKLNKKLNYANKLGIPYVIFIGENEVNNKRLKLKDMNTGNQLELSEEEVIKFLLAVGK